MEPGRLTVYPCDLVADATPDGHEFSAADTASSLFIQNLCEGAAGVLPGRSGGAAEASRWGGARDRSGLMRVGSMLQFRMFDTRESAAPARGAGPGTGVW